MSDNKDNRIKILDKYPGPFMIPGKGIASSTNPGTPNQLAEINRLINEGWAGAEIGALDAKVWQSIPKQVQEDIARVARINDVQLTIHAPIYDQSEGIGSLLPGLKNNKFIKEGEKHSAYALYDVLRDAGEMAKIYGKEVKVVTHASDIALNQWDKKWEQEAREWIKKNWNEDIKRKFEYLLGKQINSPDELPSWVFAKSLGVVSLDNPKEKEGQISIVPAKIEEDPITGRRIIKTVADEIIEINEAQWKRMLNQVWEYSNRLKQKIVNISQTIAGHALYDPSKIGLFYSAIASIDNETKAVRDYLYKIYNYLKAEAERRKDPSLIEEIRKLDNKLKEIEAREKVIQKIKTRLRSLEKIAAESKRDEYQKIAQYIFDQLIQSKAAEIYKIEDVLNEIGKFTMKHGAPMVIAPIEEVVKERDAKVLREAFKNWFEWVKTTDKEILENPEKLQQIMPHIVIENFFAEAPGGRADELSEIIEKARQELVDLIKKEYPEIYKKLGEEGVKKLAEQKIGATWDIGHIKRLIKEGYSPEDIRREVQKIKDYVHHVHVTENKGMEDTHLLPGMARDDVWKIHMQELADKLLEKGVTVVGEFGNWMANFHQAMGGTYMYNLKYSDQVFVPEYFAGVSPTGTPGYVIPNYSVVYSQGVTQYDPLGYGVFSGLPTDLGGSSKRQTFTGLRD